MATSSFSKTFIFTADATKKVADISKKSGVTVSASTDRIKEGKKALTRFSSPSKK